MDDELTRIKLEKLLKKEQKLKQEIALLQSGNLIPDENLTKSIHENNGNLELENNSEKKDEEKIETIPDVETPLNTNPNVSTLENMVQELQGEKTLGEKLFEDDNLEMKSRLNKAQIVQMSVAKLFARVHDLPEIDMLLDDIMKMSVSDGGLGRREAVEITRSGLGNLQDPQVLARIRG